MKKFCLLIPLIVSVISASCDKHHKNLQSYENCELEQYNFDSAEDVLITDVFDGVEIIPILFDGDNYPKGLRGNIVTENNIFLHDLNGKLHVFTADGHYVACSDEKFGQGPEEFQVITGFNWNDQTDEIELMTPNSLKCYDTNFNFKRSSRLETQPGREENKCLFYDEICHIDHDRLLALPSGVSENPFRIITLNPETGKGIDEFDYSQDVIGRFSIQPAHFFNLCSGELLFIPKGINNKIYRIDKENLSVEPIVRLDYGRNGITENDIAGQDRAKFMIETELEFPVITIPTSSKLFIGVKHGSDASDGYLIIADRNTGELSRLNLKKDGKMVMSLMNYGDEDYMYVIDKKEFFQSQPSMLMDKAEKADSIFANIEEDTYVLLKYKIKD